MSVKTRISLEEYARRSDKLRQYMDGHQLDGLCIFDAMRISYISGFHHRPTERPVVLVLPLKGEMALLLPRLEEENVAVRTPHIKEVKVYREYPGLKHPMQHLSELLGERGLADKNLGVDSEGWGGGSDWGYRGPILSEVAPHARLTNVRDVIDNIRMVKSDEELSLIRLSAHYGIVAHRMLQDYVEVGVSELAISLRALADATTYVMNEQGQEWEPAGRGAWGSVNLTSGPKTALNHREAGSRKIQKGDVLLTEIYPEVGGYNTELERMLIVGPPTDQHKKYFELELQAQDIALAAIRPGARCCDVEKAVNAFLEEHNLYGLTRTHIGHGVGMGRHEAPFFDLGDETVLKPGMVMSVEPCFFLPGFAGFRHSDTVVVTEDGVEMITRYPRDLESLTIQV